MTSRSLDQTSGWVLFAGTLALLIGVLNIFWGFVALFNSEWVIFTEQSVVLVDVTAWAWVTLLLGVIQIFVAWGILSGQTWARVVGIIWAGLAIIGQMVYINVAPWWSLIMIIMLVLVIYGLAVHGDEIAD